MFQEWHTKLAQLRVDNCGGFAPIVSSKAIVSPIFRLFCPIPATIVQYLLVVALFRPLFSKVLSMSLHKTLSTKTANAPAKAPSTFVKVATVCVLVISSGLVMKSAYEMKNAVRDIQRTVAETELPEQAEGAFYFIEPSATATL